MGGADNSLFLVHFKIYFFKGCSLYYNLKVAGTAHPHNDHNFFCTSIKSAKFKSIIVSVL